MLETLHTDGLGVLWANEWHRLCEAIRDAAEGYAATDAPNAWLYRDEARAFCGNDPPADDARLRLLEDEASNLRKRWSDRIGR